MSENKLLDLSFEFAVAVVKLIDCISANRKALRKHPQAIDFLLQDSKRKYSIKATDRRAEKKAKAPLAFFGGRTEKTPATGTMRKILLPIGQEDFCNDIRTCRNG